MEGVIGAAVFVLGLFLAFAVEGARGSATRLNELLKALDADLLTIARLSEVFGGVAAEDTRALIDLHLQDQIDFRLLDFHRSSTSFEALARWVREVHPKGPRQELAYAELLAVVARSRERRKVAEGLVRQRVSRTEWASLITLLIVLGVGLAASTHWQVFHLALLTLLLGALAVMLRVLWKLDSFRWHEDVAIWEPLERLFGELGAAPYFPAELVQSGRYRPRAAVYRLGVLRGNYPDFTDKVVLTVGPQAQPTSPTADTASRPTEGGSGRLGRAESP